MGPIIPGNASGAARKSPCYDSTGSRSNAGEENVTDRARFHADVGVAREPFGEGLGRLLGGS